MESRDPTVPASAGPTLAVETPSGVSDYARGARVGRCVILEKLGEGGFADVYLAEQTEPIRRRVAIKLIKPGMESRQILARFEAERQALALMDHPNVAKVIDAGTTDAGRPFFVMEHVAGVPITEHCDRSRLEVEPRLRLFVQVCRAVQHAHQKGIIHRDIKPSNILVTVREGQAAPKVIDFGVAKALHQRLSERTVYTEQGQLIGTPEYMSPEQAELTAQDVDTRSDVYSLGVLLYELLTGALPFDPATLRRASIAELQRMICEEDPQKPSTRISPEQPPRPAGATRGSREQDARTLSRALRGDLDWIVMKCLEKDRARRYETADALAMDVERHLAHEPVLAGPPSAGYRLAKFARRNRTAVVAGAIVALALVAASGVSIAFALSEAKQRARAADAAARADLEARRATDEAAIASAVNAFLNDDLLAAVAPSTEKGRGKDVRMREVLDEAARRIEQAARAGGRFEGTPLVEASIRSTLGETYRRLGEFAAAEPHLARARTLRDEALGSEDALSLASAHALAVLWSDMARYDDAETLHRTTLAARERTLGKEHRETLSSANNLAILYWREGRYDEAEPLYLETLALRRRVLGEDDPETLRSANNLALLYAKQGRDDEAEPLYLETLATRRRQLGAEHADTLTSLGNLANLYVGRGRLDEAERLYVEALATRTRVLGAEHPDTLRTIVNLATVHRRQGRDAEGEFSGALAIQRRVLGAEHPETIASMNNLANLYVGQGRLAEAEPLYRETRAARERVLGENHPDTLLATSNLAEVCAQRERLDEAAVLLAEAVERAPGVFGESHWITGSLEGQYGRVLARLGRFEEAEELLLEGQALVSAALPAHDPRAVEQIEGLAALYDAWGKPDEAAAWRSRSAGVAAGAE